MSRLTLPRLACAALITLPASVYAQDSGLSWNVSAVSEYLYRSVSQSDEHPTVQGELSWTSPIGVYVGSWASGVDFGPGDPNMEIDYYLGYRASFAHDLGTDVRLARYTNPGASELAWNELIMTTTFKDSWYVELHYSNDVFASDTTGWYWGVGNRWQLPLDVSFSAHAGRSLFQKNRVVGRDYTDWNIGFSRAFDLFNVSLGYYGTDGNGRRNYGKFANSRVFLAVSIEH